MGIVTLMSAERGDGAGVRAQPRARRPHSPLPAGLGQLGGACGRAGAARGLPGVGSGAGLAPGCSRPAAGGAALQYPGVQPHPLHSRALGLRLLGRAQQAQRGPEVPPSVVPVPGLVGAAGGAAEAVSRLGAGGREHGWRGRCGAALPAGGHRLRLDADVGVGGDCEGGPHVGQRAARAGHQDRSKEAGNMGVGGRGRRWGREGRTRRAARGETGNKGRSHVSSFRPVSPKTAWCSGLAWEGLRGCLSVPHVPCRPLVTEHLGGGHPAPDRDLLFPAPTLPSLSPLPAPGRPGTHIRLLRDTGTRWGCGWGCCGGCCGGCWGCCGGGWGCCGWGGCAGCVGCGQAVTLPSDSPPGELKVGREESSALLSW